MHKDELVLGVICALAIDEFYLAERGSGAYLNGGESESRTPLIFSRATCSTAKVVIKTKDGCRFGGSLP
jgi:fructose-1,6-bisphosphatase/inositol monophosphatase family enzyme